MAFLLRHGLKSLSFTVWIRPLKTGTVVKFESRVTIPVSNRHHRSLTQIIEREHVTPYQNLRVDRNFHHAKTTAKSSFLLALVPVAS